MATLMDDDHPPTIEWGKPLDPVTANLVRAAMVLRDGPPLSAELNALGSRDFSDMQILSIAAHLIRRGGDFAATAVGALLFERMLAGDDPNTDFWLRVVHAMAKIGQVEPEPGDLLH